MGRPSASNFQDDLSPRILPPTTPVPLDFPHSTLVHLITIPTSTYIYLRSFDCEGTSEHGHQDMSRAGKLAPEVNRYVA